MSFIATYNNASIRGWVALGTSPSGNNYSQVQQITPANIANNTFFGHSVSMDDSGYNFVAGLTFGGGNTQGNAFVYQFDGVSYNQTAIISANNGQANDFFSSSLAMSGDASTIIVGAYGANGASGSNQGTAYVFRNTGNWTQQAQLIPNNLPQFDEFIGLDVATTTTGNTAVVGSSDGVWVFDYVANVWTQTAYIPRVTTFNQEFGRAVAITGDGNVLVVGAPGDNSAGETTGRAYVYSRSGNNWTLEATLSGNASGAFEDFGESVDISDTGQYVVVGSWLDNNQQGCAYVFSNIGGIWTQQAQLLATDAPLPYRAGWQTEINSDGTIVVLGSDRVNNVGRAYVFTRNNTTWTQSTKLTNSDDYVGDRFGYSVAVNSSASTIVIGKPAGSTANNSVAPAVYVFKQ